MPRDFNAEAERLINLITGKKLTREHPTYQRCLEWLGFWPSELPTEKKQQLLTTVCESYEVTESQLLEDVGAGHARALELTQPEESFDESELRAILPKNGWFEWYDEYTARTEAPLSYHIFASLVVLGAAMGRQAWFEMGHWRVYPNICCIIVGPTGRVYKTTTIDIAHKLLREAMVCPTLSDKVTPEAFVLSLQKHGGHQFVYAPEFSVLFNRQRYNDGFVTMVIRMLDCPDVFRTETIARGEQEVEGVCLSILGGSTLSLLSTSSPTEVMSSGFLNRFLIIVENGTDRCFPIPSKGDPRLEELLIERIKRLKTFSGAFRFSEEAMDLYTSWYAQRKRYLYNAPNEMVAEVLQRTPTHLQRLAMVIHAVQCDNQLVCSACLEAAIGLLQYIERRIPELINSVSQTLGAQDTSFILDTLERCGRTADHSTLLRKVAHRMNAAAFRSHITTLAESGQIKIMERGKLRFYSINFTTPGEPNGTK